MTDKLIDAGAKAISDELGMTLGPSEDAFITALQAIEAAGYSIVPTDDVKRACAEARNEAAQLVMYGPSLGPRKEKAYREEASEILEAVERVEAMIEAAKEEG